MSESFNIRLRRIRLYVSAKEGSKSYTQTGMAERLGLARQTYLDLESGKREPRLSTIQNISKILGVDECYLAFGYPSNQTIILDNEIEVLETVLDKLVDIRYQAKKSRQR